MIVYIQGLPRAKGMCSCLRCSSLGCIPHQSTYPDHGSHCSLGLGSWGPEKLMLSHRCSRSHTLAQQPFLSLLKCFGSWLSPDDSVPLLWQTESGPCNWERRILNPTAVAAALLQHMGSLLPSGPRPLLLRCHRGWT